MDKVFLGADGPRHVGSASLQPWYRTPQHASLESLEQALGKNRQLQKSLWKQLQQLQERQKRNVELQRLLGSPSVWPSASEKTGLRSRKEPFFVDPRDDSTPPDNYDTKIQKALYGSNRKVEIIYSRPEWLPTEMEELRTAVIRQNKMIFFNRQTGEVEAHENKLVESLEGLNWKSIAGYIGSRTAKDCLRQWTVVQHPYIANVAQRPFTMEEIKKLEAAVEKYEGRNWDGIAAEVGNNRVAIQCFRAYQTRFSFRRDWMPEDDERLIAAVEKWGKQWSKVASEMGDRTRKQCSSRWRTIHPQSGKGRWTAEEDENLLKGVELYGRGNWVKVATLVITRTAAQCRERYERSKLNPNVTGGTWTPKEYKQFRRLVLNNPNLPLQEVAAALSRPDFDVRRKYRQLREMGYFDETPSDEAIKYLKRVEEKEKARRQRNTSITNSEVSETVSEERGNEVSEEAYLGDVVLSDENLQEQGIRTGRDVVESDKVLAGSESEHLLAGADRGQGMEPKTNAPDTEDHSVQKSTRKRRRIGEVEWMGCGHDEENTFESEEDLGNAREAARFGASDNAMAVGKRKQRKS